MTWFRNEPNLNQANPDPISPKDLAELAPWSLVVFAACCLRRATEFAAKASNRAPGDLSGEITDVLAAALQLTAGPPFASQPKVVKDNAAKAAELVISKSKTDIRHEDSRYEDTAPDEDEAYRTVAAAAYVAESVAEVVEAAVQQKNPILMSVEVAKRLYATALHFVGSQFYWNDDYSKALEIYRPETLRNIRQDLESARNLTRAGNELSAFCSVQLKAINDALSTSLSKNPLLIHELSPRKFEELIADVLLDMGCEVQLTPLTRDGGRDILAKAKTPIGELLLIVECKKYRPDRKIGIDIVERFLYVLDRKDNASCGLIATTSFFSLDARIVANQLRYRLKLRDFDGVSEWIGQYGKWKRDDRSMLWTPTVPDGPLLRPWREEPR